MAHIFQKMSPGMVTMASTDKNILIYDVSSLKRGIFYVQTCLKWNAAPVTGTNKSFLTDSLKNIQITTIIIPQVIGALAV